ncbi:MAG: hypothetical protein M1820_001666 [Bogoriella megaspora]|nr:MAG: hypothetical protein M1820_001666 [Bogoriella megaspora]
MDPSKGSLNRRSFWLCDKLRRSTIAVNFAFYFPTSVTFWSKMSDVVSFVDEIVAELPARVHKTLSGQDDNTSISPPSQSQKPVKHSDKQSIAASVIEDLTAQKAATRASQGSKGTLRSFLEFLSISKVDISLIATQETMEPVKIFRPVDSEPVIPSLKSQPLQNPEPDTGVSDSPKPKGAESSHVEGKSKVDKTPYLKLVQAAHLEIERELEARQQALLKKEDNEKADSKGDGSSASDKTIKESPKTSKPQKQSKKQRKATMKQLMPASSDKDSSESSSGTTKPKPEPKKQSSADKGGAKKQQNQKRQALKAGGEQPEKKIKEREEEKVEPQQNQKEEIKKEDVKESVKTQASSEEKAGEQRERQGEDLDAKGKEAAKSQSSGSRKLSAKEEADAWRFMLYPFANKVHSKARSPANSKSSISSPASTGVKSQSFRSVMKSALSGHSRSQKSSSAAKSEPISHPIRIEPNMPMPTPTQSQLENAYATSRESSSAARSEPIHPPPIPLEPQELIPVQLENFYAAGRKSSSIARYEPMPPPPITLESFEAQEPTQSQLENFYAGSRSSSSKNKSERMPPPPIPFNPPSSPELRFEQVYADSRRSSFVSGSVDKPPPPSASESRMPTPPQYEDLYVGSQKLSSVTRSECMPPPPIPEEDVFVDSHFKENYSFSRESTPMGASERSLPSPVTMVRYLDRSPLEERYADSEQSDTTGRFSHHRPSHRSTSRAGSEYTPSHIPTTASNLARIDPNSPSSLPVVTDPAEWSISVPPPPLLSNPDSIAPWNDNMHAEAEAEAADAWENKMRAAAEGAKPGHISPHPLSVESGSRSTVCKYLKSILEQGSDLIQSTPPKQSSSHKSVRFAPAPESKSRGSGRSTSSGSHDSSRHSLHSHKPSRIEKWLDKTEESNLELRQLPTILERSELGHHSSFANEQSQISAYQPPTVKSLSSDASGRVAAVDARLDEIDQRLEELKREESLKRYGGR